MTSTAAETTAGRVASYPVRRPHVEALVRQVSDKSGARVVALQTAGAWVDGETVTIADRAWRVVHAETPLAVRAALVEHERLGADDRLVILTPLAEQTLGMDVLGRVARQRVFHVQPWDLVRNLFRARSFDPRLARMRWLAEVLLERAPAGGYPPAPSGVLDLDTVWRQFLGWALGIPTGTPDALVLLRWAARTDALTRWNALSADAREAVKYRFSETAGALGGAVAAVLHAGRGEEIIALGFVCEMLWPVGGESEPTLIAARIRIEPLVGGVTLTDVVAREWAALSRRVLDELPVDRVGMQLQRAEAILRELKAQELITRSNVLPGAVAVRAATYAAALEQWLAEGGSYDAVARTQAHFLAHHELARDAEQRHRADMAIRLVRALAGGDRDVATPMSLSGRVRRHLALGSWIDTARTALLGGETDPTVSRAYRSLLLRARALRDEENHYFAQALAAWNELPNAEPGIVPVERALADIVAPVAAARPVLVLLLDGLDLVVWRQLRADLSERSWTWWQPDALPTPPMGIAVLPSTTNFSRASLFAGAVKAGSQSTEKPDFAAHPALRAASVNNRHAMLFHKADLVEATGSGLADPVRRAIGDRQQRVLGAVINAVDDWLDRSDQLRPRWAVASVPLLDALLQEAAQAGRAVVVLSDHGHLLECETELCGSGESARWRAPARGGQVNERELCIRGPRVAAATGMDAVVLPWSESIRYTGRKTGYHGGITPQEVVAPIAVLSRDELGLAGWRPVLDAAPAWWGEDAAGSAAIPVPPTQPPVAMPAVVEVPASGAISAGEQRSSVWVDGLLASPVYGTQRTLAGRMAPRDEHVRLLLALLDRSQDRVSRPVMAAALGQPEIRLPGIVASIRRVLNVEGFAVLEEEEATGTVTLNRPLLFRQFGLEG